MKRLQFENDFYYHVFNRGVDRRTVFCDRFDYIRFLTSLSEFNTEKSIDSIARLEFLRSQNVGQPSDAFRKASDGLAQIVSYCLMPNHYHLILKQVCDNGISRFMHKLSMGYTNYFNLKYKRTGSLFQGKFKYIPIKQDHKLAYISAYIHGNPEIHGITKAENWPWSSYLDYLGRRQGILPEKNIVLSQFKSVQEYEEYVKMVIPECKSVKEEMKAYLIEEV